MTLIVCPLHELPQALALHRPSHLVSLLSPASPPVDYPGLAPDQRLHLSFHDIAEAREGLTPPSETDVRALLAFARAWPATAPLLFHCWAGISRSTAAAYIVACDRAGVGREEELAARLRQVAPSATPNPLLVRLADRLLGRDGAMTAAITSIGRGAEAASGAVFGLDWR